MKKTIQQDKKKVLRQVDHLTTPPRMEGKAKNAGLNPVRKTKKSEGNPPIADEIS